MYLKNGLINNINHDTTFLQNKNKLFYYKLY